MPLNVLLVSRSAPALQTMQAALRGNRGLHVSTRLMSNGHADPLHGLTAVPDVLVLRFDDAHLAELGALAEMDAARRPAVVLIGPLGNAEAMRLAFRCGARDFLTEPLDPVELVGALERIGTEARRPDQRPIGTLTAFIGAGGGVGTSLLAANVGHQIAASQRDAMIVDTDLQFGAIAQLLDLDPGLGILGALDAVETLDGVALDGFAARHASGLRVLSTSGDARVDARHVSPERLVMLCETALRYHDHVIVDVPRGLDERGATVCGIAQSVFLVLQQSVVHVRNAVRMKRTLVEAVGIPEERIHVVVSRHSKNAAVSADDVQQSLRCERVLLVPNHYKSAHESVDTGVPLAELDPNGPISRALTDLVATAAGQAQAERPQSLLRRALPMFTRK